MMNKRNYQRELDALLTEIEKEHKIPRLFLPQLLCTVQQLCAGISFRNILRSRYFFYNPNISLEEEYRKRVEGDQKAGQGNEICPSGPYRGRKL